MKKLKFIDQYGRQIGPDIPVTKGYLVMFIPESAVTLAIETQIKPKKPKFPKPHIENHGGIWPFTLLNKKPKKKK